MGYTHTFSSTRPFDDAEWTAITRDIRRLIAASRIPLASAWGDAGTKPKVSRKQIAFNGVDDDSHEDFRIPRVPSPDDWSFCKTARKPYDMVVTAALLIIHHHAPGVLKITSDGRQHEWEPGRVLATLVLNAPANIPATVRV